jgi:DNA-binding MarR family transcriptional regulator
VTPTPTPAPTPTPTPTPPPTPRRRARTRPRNAEPTPEPTQESVGIALKRAEQTLLRAKSRALRDVGLTLPQYVALVELDAHPGIAGATLARACLVTPQAMMVVLKSMDEQGLIERTPHPRHGNVVEIRLTDVGREALSAGRRQAQPIERRVLGAFSEQELATLRALLTRMVQAIEG